MTGFTIEQISTCSNEAFADYFGHPIVWTPEELTTYVPNHCISLERSLVACPEGSDTPIGFALMAYRDDLPGHARLAGMGVVPSWAGKGVASKLLTAVVAQARAEGTHTIWLEVIDINTRAIRLYTKFGFQVERHLNGWNIDTSDTAAEQPAAAEGEQSLLEEITPQEVLELNTKYAAAADIPWQIWHQFPLTSKPEKSRAFRLGQAYCAITNPDDASNETIALQALAVDPEARRQGQATALLRAVMARFPGKKWKVGAIMPRECGERIAEKLGAAKLDDNIALDLMKLSLA